MTTTATSPADTLVDVPDLLARLKLAVEHLSDLRDSTTGSEKARLAGKIEGLNRGARVFTTVLKGLDVPVGVAVDTMTKLDPAARTNDSISVEDHHISAGVQLSIEYVHHPKPLGAKPVPA